MDSGSHSLQNPFSTFEVNTSPSLKCLFSSANTWGCVWAGHQNFPVCSHPQRHSAGHSQRSPFSLAPQLLCQQPLFIPGLLLHCVVVYYFVRATTAAHPSAHRPALHPLLGAVAGSRPPLTHQPHQPLSVGHDLGLRWSEGP